MATMIQVAHVEGQFSVGMSMTENGYHVSYGLEGKAFPRTPSGLFEAVKEFERYYAHALTCAADEIEEGV